MQSISFPLQIVAASSPALYIDQNAVYKVSNNYQFGISATSVGVSGTFLGFAWTCANGTGPMAGPCIKANGQPLISFRANSIYFNPNTPGTLPAGDYYFTASVAGIFSAPLHLIVSSSEKNFPKIFHSNNRNLPEISM